MCFFVQFWLPFLLSSSHSASLRSRRTTGRACADPDLGHRDLPMQGLRKWQRSRESCLFRGGEKGRHGRRRPRRRGDRQPSGHRRRFHGLQRRKLSKHDQLVRCAANSGRRHRHVPLRLARSRKNRRMVLPLAFRPLRQSHSNAQTRILRLPQRLAVLQSTCGEIAIASQKLAGEAGHHPRIPPQGRVRRGVRELLLVADDGGLVERQRGGRLEFSREFLGGVHVQSSDVAALRSPSGTLRAREECAFP